MEFTDKFIGFIDILGFKNLVHSAEAGDGKISLSKLLELTKKLGSPEDRLRFETHGPMICPMSPYLRRDLDFQVTQITDCAIASAEISPAGIINLIGHCWQAVTRLLDEGIMCRGYITRGKIYHLQGQFIGSGYQSAYDKEKEAITAFKRDPEERGTPFIEIDPVVSEYVKNCEDKCVQQEFSRLVKIDGEVAALFPFKTIQHTFAIGGLGPGPDLEKQRESNRNVRNWILNLKNKLSVYVDPANADAVKKLEHYLAALDEQLRVCDRLDRIIDSLPTIWIRPKIFSEAVPTVDHAITRIKDLPDWPPSNWRSEDYKFLNWNTASGCLLEQVSMPVAKSNFVTLKILHEDRSYSAHLIVPTELKERIWLTLLFVRQSQPILIGEIGDLDIM